MSVQQAGLISLGLLVMLQHCACVCNVTCSTDFIARLNCSCSAPGPVVPCRVEAECWDTVDYVNGSCEISPPQTWCQMEPEDFGDIISIGINCIARVKYPNEEKNEREDYTHMKLYQHIRLLPPLNMQLAEDSGVYNFSWEMAYTEEENYYLIPYLMYRVRIRKVEEPLKEPELFLVKGNSRFLAVPRGRLPPGAEYAADVQATVDPAVFQAQWSDWGPAVTWKIKSQDYKGMELYIILPLVSLLWVFLYCCRKVGWLKMCSWQYIPSPEDFFKPLYHTHQGDFKNWVGPTFTLCEFDFVVNSLPVQVLDRKQTGVLEGLCEGGNEVGVESGRPEAGSSLDPSYSLAHSAGHVSIHTVVVSEDDSHCTGGSLGPYGDSQNSLVYRGGGLGDEEGPLDAETEGEWAGSGAAMERDALSGLPAIPIPRAYGMEWRPVVGDDEQERISLDSFGSVERSEDGYPAVQLDLDTIDSGFQEPDCSSPVGSEFSGAEPREGGAGDSHTNYIKQWVAFTSAVGETGGRH
ncbi:interleukin-21 receptor-like [Anguilla rostrata]|uniref:interleukin-21 receptor-like n=1 Tax=Anguilla rostrata TaxID=7938 RepID=UPI0030D5994F